MQTFKRNEKVQDREGKVWTVCSHKGVSVYMFEDNGFAPIHASNLRKLEIKAGTVLRYNDGRPGHTDARATVLSVSDSGMVVQFSDRADTTTIRFDDKGWMQFLTVCK